MKKSVIYPLWAGIFLLCSTGIVSATTITMDENGHGTNGTTPLPFNASGTNPNAPFQSPVLVYTLPFAGVAGNVLLTEPGTSIPGDVLQFNGDGTVIFYSKIDSDNALAERFSPPIFPFPVHNSITIAEGVSGSATYTPTAGQPGFDSSAPTYIFTSDVTSTVPEPASIALLLLGAPLLIRQIRSHRRGSGRNISA